MSETKNSNLDLDFVFDDNEDPDIQSLFEENHFDDDDDKDDHIISQMNINTKDHEPITQKKMRSLCDFEPDMDALLLTAESSMIIEGMKYYTKSDFSSNTLPIYLEARKGIEFYMKILNRSPNNYRRLKILIDSDIDCQKVERIAFNLYQRLYDEIPETDRQKLDAFENLHFLFKEATQKASISNSMKTLKKYLLISGKIDEGKLRECSNREHTEFKNDINNLRKHLKLALEMTKKGNSEITKNIKGKDLNVFIIRTSEFLSYYYRLVGNDENVNYFNRIFNIYRKYFVIRD
ncbi:MAG: hypothetical protein SVZ03_14560 [Spirochaetota bacterium]|nr:hypothetical protein [Spirochaetota bacterium]